jgi:SAM-dependent methyltransferase
VAELGPGDSIGTGLAALLTGADKYYALDVVEYANMQANLNIFEELVSLFDERRPIPGRDEFPEITPQLTSCRFPHEILTDESLAKTLDPSRIQEIRNALVCGTGCESAIEIRYFVPWHDAGVIEPESVDMIFSQAVLEHVDDLGGTYEALYRWLKPGGFMSHQIDLSSHCLSKHWNGHWACSDFMWKLIKGNRPWLINREPYSTHHDLIEKTGFDIVSELKADDMSGINRNHLATRFTNFTDDDFKTRTAYVLVREKA